MGQQFISYRKNDEFYTPKNVVESILKYLKPNSIIWCPFDKEWSNFNIVLTAAGHKVILGHIDNGQDFLICEEPKEYDYIISNPPYSINREIMDRLMQLDKPFAMLLGIQVLSVRSYMKKWNEYHRQLQLMFFENKAFFINGVDKPKHYKKPGAYFHTFYFCNGWLPKDLILTSLKKGSE